MMVPAQRTGSGARRHTVQEAVVDREDPEEVVERAVLQRSEPVADYLFIMSGQLTRFYRHAFTIPYFATSARWN